jgi:pimeloyl-ACP methyl ester carboxylesterase
MTITTSTLTHNGMSFSVRSAGSGPLVLLLHGFPDDNHTFDLQLLALAEAGYRAVAPMMRGYEPGSQSPKNLYHLIHLAADVFAWMDLLGERKCYLIGHDWGALTSYVAAALQPKKFHCVTTLAIPHLRRGLKGVSEVPVQLLKSSYILLMQLPKVSELIVERDDYAFIETLWRRWSPDWLFSAEELEQVKSTFRQPGVVKAATQYYRSLLSPLSLSAQQSWSLLTSQIEVPVLALAGENDGCMDARLFEHLMQSQDFDKGLSVDCLPGAGHFLHREQPAVVNGLILEWLARHKAG